MDNNKKSSSNLIILMVIIFMAGGITAYGLATRGQASISAFDISLRGIIYHGDIVPEQSPVPTLELPEPSADAADPAAVEEAQAQFEQLQQFCEEKAAEYMTVNPAESYLLVTTQSSIYLPMPLAEETSFTITQDDGSENIIHIGPNSFYMESSNCDNQNCIGQGEVTLENMGSRILYNMIICLPHNLSLEMLTPEEAQETVTSIYLQEILYRLTEEGSAS